MMSRIRRARPSPAIAIALLALVAAMTTTAIAGQGASTSAVSKKKVRKIATNIAQNITRKKFSRRFPIGGGDLGTITTRSAQTTMAPSPASTTFEATASCQPGEKVLSGGVNTPSESGPGPQFTVLDSHKVGEGWRVQVTNGAGNPPPGQTLTVEAYCLAP
jgi:hypothetical protein